MSSDLTENFEKFAADAAAPPAYFKFEANYAGAIATPAASFPRGATFVELQLPTTVQTLNREIRVVKSFVTPRLPQSSRLAFSALEDIPGDLAITNLPLTDALYYGPVFTGNNPYTSTPYEQFSTGQVGSYAAKYSDADVSRLNLPPGFKVGCACLNLGGCVVLDEFLDEVFGVTAAHDSLYYSYLGTAPVAIDDVTNPLTGISGLTGAVLDTALSAVVSCGIVTVDPPQDPCNNPRMAFTIKKGTAWPGDYSIIDKCTGDPITNPTVKPEHCGCAGIENSSVFLEDWVFDTDKYVFSESTVLERYEHDALPVVSFHPHTKLTLNFAVTATLELGEPIAAPVTPGDFSYNNFLAYLETGDLVLYIKSGDGPGFDMTSQYNLLAPAIADTVSSNDVEATIPSDRTVPLFGNKTVIPRGSSFPCGFTTDVGMDFPESMIIPAGSSLIAPSEADPAGANPPAVAQSRILLDYAVVPKRFVFAGTYRFVDIIPNADKLKLPPGSLLTEPSSLPLSSSWTSFPISDADIAAGHILAADLLFNKSQTITSSVLLTCGSVLAKGSVLEDDSDFVTDVGMVSTKDLKFSAGSLIISPYTVCHPTTTCAGSDFLEGTIFGANTHLPPGLEITNGNITPADIQIPVNAGVTLKAGSELVNPVLGGGFTWNEGTGFEPCSDIPAGSVISAGVVLPARTTFFQGSKFPFAFPLPQGTVFEPCNNIPAYTVFVEGTALPAIFAKPNMIFPVPGESEAGLADIPYTFITLNNKSYMVLRSGTVLSSGCTLAKGTVLLATTDLEALDPTVTGSPTFSTGAYDSGAWVTGGGTLTFNETEYTYISCHGPSGEDFVLAQGVPSSNGIHVKVQVVTTFDIAIPMNDSAKVFEGISFNIPFVLQVDSRPECKYVVSEDNSVYHPPNKEICYPAMINTDFIVQSQFTAVRKIQLPNAPTCYITTLIPDNTTWIKFPASVQTTHRKFKIGRNGLAINASASKVGLTIKAGNVINVTTIVNTSPIDALVLSNAICIHKDWKLLTALEDCPPINATKYHLPAGSKLPVSITICAGNELPAGLTPANPIQLERDYVVSPHSSPVRIAVGSRILCNSVFARGSEFIDGFSATGVTYGEVSCWASSDDITLSAGDPLPPSLLYNYFGDTNSLSTYQDTSDMNELFEEVANLKSQVKTLEAALAARR